MCCNRIDTDAILANLFAVPDGGIHGYTLEQIESYFSFVVESWPCYVSTDFSRREVYACIQRYPELYCVSRKPGERERVRRGKLRPSLTFFNAAFSESAAKYLADISEVYVDGLKPASQKKKEGHSSGVRQGVHSFRRVAAQG